MTSPHARRLLAAAAAVAALLAAPADAAGERLRPYLLGFRGPAALEAKAGEVMAALEEKGFQVVGEHSPGAGVRVFAATSEALRAAAAKSPFGAYGAVVRVSVTDAGSEVQVAATNPRYHTAAYRMKEPLDDVAAAVEQALGRTSEFGSKDGLTAEKLREYHYMMMMPRFDDPVELAKLPSHEAALGAVESGLAAGKGSPAKVYRVDVPGGKESVFGVAIAQGEGADDVVRKACDGAELKHSPPLPLRDRRLGREGLHAPREVPHRPRLPRPDDGEAHEDLGRAVRDRGGAPGAAGGK
jgi:hypothetical protein